MSKLVQITLLFVGMLLVEMDAYECERRYVPCDSKTPCTSTSIMVNIGCNTTKTIPKTTKTRLTDSKHENTNETQEQDSPIVILALSKIVIISTILCVIFCTVFYKS